jgi:hypothetical protein
MGIVSEFFSTAHGVHTLAVKNPNAWFCVSSKLDPQFFSETVVDMFQCSIFKPFIVIVGNLLPWRKIMR